MDYWAETMQDDVYMIVSRRLGEAARCRDGKEAQASRPDPARADHRPLLRRRAGRHRDSWKPSATPSAAQMEELDEEHGGEDGLLAEAKNDKGKLTKASVKARLEEIKARQGRRRRAQAAEQPTSP